MFRMDKLTIKSQEVLTEALERASEKGHPEITTLHLLDALVAQEQGSVGAILQRIGVQPGRVATALVRAYERLPKVSHGGAQPGLGREAQQALEEVLGGTTIGDLLRREDALRTAAPMYHI